MTDLGVNVGEAAGQAIAPPHLRVIPRCVGDVPDVRGGDSLDPPERARYWEPT